MENKIFINKKGGIEATGAKEFMDMLTRLLRKEKQKSFNEGKESIIQKLIKGIENLS